MDLFNQMTCEINNTADVLEFPSMAKPVTLGFCLGSGAEFNLANEYTVKLLGSFSIVRVDGEDITPNGKKAIALLALLATAPDGRRGRKWLQDRLWSDRAEAQGAGSLRQTLYEIRTKFGEHKNLLHANSSIISIDLTKLHIDTRNLSDVGDLPMAYRGEIPQFLEGLDILDNEFEDWLREQRNYWDSFFNTAKEYAGVRSENGEFATRSSMDENHQFFKSQDRISKNLAETENYGGANVKPHQIEFSNSVAVLPFLVRADLQEYEYVVDGISQDLLEGLARLKWLPIISYSSTSVFRDVDRDVIAIADQLGARYTIEGELSLDDTLIKLRVRLTNTATCLSLWSREFEIKSIGFQSKIQDILQEVVGIIDNKIDISEQHRIITADQPIDAFYDNIWRGRWFLNKLTTQDSIRAKKYFDAAFAIRPEDTEIQVQLGHWHLYQSWVSRATEAEIQEGAKFAQKAMALDASDARGYFLAGMAEAWLKNHHNAIELLQRSIELNPSYSMAYLQLGSVKYLSGDAKSAIEPIETAIRLSPHDRLVFDFFGELAMAHLMVGNYEASIKHATHAIWIKPRYWYGHITRICAFKKMKDVEGTERAAKVLVSTGWDLSREHFEWLPFKDRAWVEELYLTTKSALLAIK